MDLCVRIYLNMVTYANKRQAGAELGQAQHKLRLELIFT